VYSVSKQPPRQNQRENCMGPGCFLTGGDASARFACAGQFIRSGEDSSVGVTSSLTLPRGVRTGRYR
jgi:hypothetical protein